MRSRATWWLIPTCFVACVSLTQPTEADLTVLVTAHDLIRFAPDHQLDHQRVKLQKLRASGIVVLTYEYHPGEGLYLSSEASVGPPGSGEEHATRSIRGIKTAAWVKGQDLEIEEQSISPGLDGGTRFFLLRSHGKPIGNGYVTHNDRRAMFLLFSGVYFSNPEQFSAFIKPKLEALTTYSPDPQAS